MNANDAELIREMCPDRDLGATCCYCGCAELAACELEDGPCGWHVRPNDSGVGVCTNPDCVRQAQLQLEADVALLKECAYRPEAVDDVATFDPELVGTVAEFIRYQNRRFSSVRSDQ